ncbi:MAG TPA: VTT domain-containing protein [Candidatus Saccharimonadales bacterium]|nr:VTT domain-containing protein [Candidatus Saccharimonadales bacterium]
MAMLFDLPALIKAVGYLGLFAIVFAESGLLIGFFLPGDSLLFTAGFLASQGFLNIFILVPLMFTAAVLGDSVGYSFGYRAGPRIFKRRDSLVFSHQNLERSKAFYARYGGKTIMLARFVPVVRTFAPILAGVGQMPYRSFIAYNLAGALIWAVGLTCAGYWLGSVIPNADHYLLPIVAVIILASVLPALVHLLGDAGQRQKLLTAAKQHLRRKRTP